MSRAEDLNVVIKCLIELGEKEHFDLEEHSPKDVGAIIPRIKPILIEKGLRFSKRGLDDLLSSAYWELDFPDVEISRRKERLERERSAPHRDSRCEEHDLDKEEKISKAFVRWFLATRHLTLDSTDLAAGREEAVTEFKKLMDQAGLKSPATDEEMSEFFGDMIIEMDMPNKF